MDFLLINVCNSLPFLFHTVNTITMQTENFDSKAPWASSRPEACLCDLDLCPHVTEEKRFLQVCGIAEIQTKKNAGQHAL